ncbi:MAG: hypothetical protein AAB930_04080 [Patescibacteria group bacterium]
METVMNLGGRQNLYDYAYAELFPEKFKMNLLLNGVRSAAEWLCRMQEDRLAFPAGLDPEGKKVFENNPRLSAIAGSALIEYGRAVNEPRFIIAADKAFNYIKRRIENLRFRDSYTLAQVGIFAIKLGESDYAAEFSKEITGKFDAGNIDPTVANIVAKFLKIMPSKTGEEARTLEKILAGIKNNFYFSLEHKLIMASASYADTPGLLKDIDKKSAEDVLRWVASQEMPSGGFQRDTDFHVACTRGTARIFRAFADQREYTEILERSIPWLLSLQYSAHNAFGFPSGLAKFMSGGFRYKIKNSSIWLDSAAHFVSGGLIYQNGILTQR